MGYPLFEEDNRALPPGFNGPVFIWDIDKTYLATHFSSIRGLARIPIEFAVDKNAIPGMPEILRGLRNGPGPGFACTPLYFVTAGPPLLRKVLEQKMLLDGVEFDGITFKDWFRTLKQRRPGRLREQVGYKLCALLSGRYRRPMATEYLFGDDVEQDATAFHLYAMLIHREISAGEAVVKLTEAGVRKDDRRHVGRLLDRLPHPRGRVKQIFIHLEKGTPPAHFEPFGKIVAPVKTSFQLGLALYEQGLIRDEAVLQSRSAVLLQTGAADEDLDAQRVDAVERGLISRKKASAFRCG